MKKLTVLLVSLLATSPALARCFPVASDVGVCFAEAFTVDAYRDVDAAETHRRALPEPERELSWLITTGDQTRRALVVYPWDTTTRGSQPFPKGDVFVAEFYSPSFGVDDLALAEKRWDSLTPDQKAGAQRLIVPAEFRGGGVLLVFRTFGR